MEKYQIVANGLTFNCDSLSQEYSQLDGETSGRSEDGTMFRDVIGTMVKVSCGFEKRRGSDLRNLLSLISLTSTTLNYYDFRARARLSKSVYAVVDKIDIKLINGEEIAERFEVRFIQMDVN